MLGKPEFGMRVAQLRLGREEHISARDMSLSIGQSEGYISSIENGHNYPSMEVFFYICDYLGITPIEFFDIERKDPRRMNRLLEAVRGLDSEQLDHLIAIAKDLKRR